MSASFGVKASAPRKFKNILSDRVGILSSLHLTSLSLLLSSPLIHSAPLFFSPLTGSVTRHEKHSPNVLSGGLVCFMLNTLDIYDAVTSHCGLTQGQTALNKTSG